LPPPLQELYGVYAGAKEKVSDMPAAAAAAVLQACRDCHIDRTIKEICKAASPERNMTKALSKAHRDLTRVRALLSLTRAADLRSDGELNDATMLAVA
jgi:transcription initiation factor TFIIIB Brf1 subunit/transcription initiation factor TFIIB